MSIEEAEAIENSYEQWDSKRARQGFLNRMERKLNRKERFGRQ